MNTLSVVVSVLNGERFLADCLASVAGIADEIIVVDYGSTDKTIAIAKKFTKKIYQQKNNPETIDIQKNFGFEKATKDWILSLDADEMITPELKEEVHNLLKTSPAHNAYRIPRKNIIFGKWMEHTGWYPDYQLRLFKKGQGKYTKKHVHEELTVEGTTGLLTSPIMHENYQTVSQFLQKNLLVYALNEAEYMRHNGYVFSYADGLSFPVKEFLSRYFAREGYKDGFHGLILSLLMAVYHFTIFLYLWENEKFSENSQQQTFAVLASQIHGLKKEFHYWIGSVRIKETKSKVSRLLLKTKRKLGL